MRVVDCPQLIVPDVREHLDWLLASAALADAVGEAARAELAGLIDGRSAIEVGRRFWSGLGYSASGIRSLLTRCPLMFD